MAPRGSKTRTSAAHGVNAIKKQYKSSASPSAALRSAKSQAQHSAEPAKSSTTSLKRKAADDDEKAGGNVRLQVHAPSKLLNTPDEIDFPRGGGTNLTQVEVREAQLEGLREAQDDDIDMEDDSVSQEAKVRQAETEIIKDKSKAKRRKLERALQGEIKEKNKLPKDAYRVEHLNYKRLIAGTKVLGVIILVRPLELIVSLPNQLLAHVPITNISPEFTARLEEEESSSEDELDEEQEDNASRTSSSRDSTLASLFAEGQWVSAVVSSSKMQDSKVGLGGREGDENVRASRRVELSLEPEKVNEGIAKGDLKAGFTLTGAVRSVEDHGYILSLGLPSLTSFLSFKEAKKLQDERLKVGQLITCRVKDVSENGRTCNVTVGRAEVIGSSLTSATSITSILPSTLVTALVTATLPSGLNVKFFGYFDGTIDVYHLGGLNPEQDFKIGQKVKARVIWDSIASTPKKFSLSMSAHVLSMAEASVDGQELASAFPIGRQLESVKVTRLDEEWGLTCEVQAGSEAVTAFVHISKITDDHLATIPKSGPWRVGTAHRARVIGYSAFDGLVQLSLQPSVLEKSFLRVSDVKVGDIIKGTVKRLSDSALFVSISGNVDGVVWPMHYSDIKLKHPEKRFKPGNVVKARILLTDPAKNRVVLTLKRQLVDSDLPIVTSITEAVVGLSTHAVVTKVLDSGILVDFFGGVRALIPAAEAAETFTSDLSRLFSVGKVVVARIISVDGATGKIFASTRQRRDDPAPAPAGAFESVEVGNVVSGEVAAVHESNIVLTLKPSRAKALISLAMLARHKGTDVETIRSSTVKGTTLEDLVVVSKNPSKSLVIVGLIPSKAVHSQPLEAHLSNLTFDSLVVGQKLQGRVSNKVPAGLIVQLSRTIRGRVPRTEIADDYDQSAEPTIGSFVQCLVLSIDSSNHRAELSLRPSRLGAAGKVRDLAVTSLDNLTAGQRIRGFVKNVANHGVFVELGSGVTARVQIKELFDEFVKDWKPRFSVGQLVEGKITAVDKVQGQVEMSFRKNADVKSSSVDFGDLEAGQVVRGVVKRVEAYGAFVRIDGSSINGLCHKSKITDDSDAIWTTLVKEGQAVRAVIMDVDKQNRKVSLGLKRSLFPEGSLESEVTEAEDEDEDVDEYEEDALLLDQDMLDDLEDDEQDQESASESEDDDSDSVSESEGIAEQVSPNLDERAKPVNAKSLSSSVGFQWNGGAESEDEDNDHRVNDDDSDVEEALEATQATTSATDLSGLQDRTAELDTAVPKSVADFERLVLGSPNSSYLWIQFIAFFVGLSQLDKARETGRRALKTINFRDEQEKLNVWVALLNLENSYGSEQSLDDLFKEAVQRNDAKTIHLRLIDIYERSGKTESEEELFKKTVKKFGSSSKVWTLFAQFYLTNGRPNEARDLLPRSLKSLEKRKHLKTITKFAQLEFKLGDAERGRTIFEGVVDSYPKRLDLWFVYIDMEIKQRNVLGVRALFERVLVQRLSSKKGKSVFKKWLGFEKEFGDEGGVETVKTKAKEFVESLDA